MDRLTRKQERLLRRTGDGVRMILVPLIIFEWWMCASAARAHYAPGLEPSEVERLPEMATWGNITGIYLPFFTVAAAYVWATRAAPKRNLAPNGFAMALFRDFFTVPFVALLLWLPWYKYRTTEAILDVSEFLIWYQTVLTTMAGGAFAYYFHGRVSPEKAGERGTAAASTAPRRKSPRRRKPAASAPGAAAAPEPTSAASAPE